MAYATTSPCTSWSAKQYIVAALAGTLVLTVVVILVSVVLTPAAIRFSIASAPTINLVVLNGGGKRLSITITANNTSHRAGVKYLSVIVSFRYTPNSTKKETALRPDQISPPSWQSPGSTTSINVSARFPEILLESSFAAGGSGGENATPIKVLLDAVVRFKYGRVYTRSYDIRVLCDAANYFSRQPPTLPIMCRDD